LAKTKEKLPLQFLNSGYFYPRYEDGQKVAPDYLTIVYRDERDGKKKLLVKPEPKMKFYVAKDNIDIQHPLNYIPIEHVEVMQSKFNDLPLNLAKLAGMEQDYFDLIKKSPYKARQTFHQLPFVFGTDMDIEDYYKGQFLDMYAPKQNKLTKSYFDIEVDIIDITGFPDPHKAECPINAITLVNEENKTCYTLLLRNHTNPQIQELEDDIENFKKELKAELSDEFEYKLFFFNDELKLIANFYKLVNKLQPDFCLAWNMQFDKLTILNRLEQLGVDPVDVICHPDFPEDVRRAFYKEDKRAQKFSDKGDSFDCSSFTQYLDQLILYASLRKGSGEKESYALNSVAKDELGEGKLDYSEAGDMRTLPYEDYKLFVKYNIKDVLLLRELENKNDDINMLYSLAEMTRTRLNKAMRKTISLKNMAFKFYKDQGYIMGNNHNVRLDDSKSGPTEKFEGAVVADPNLNSNVGMELNGRFSQFVFQKVIDFDLSALYPSIIRAFNVDATTQYGRLYIGDIVPSKDYDPAGEFTDHLETKNWIEIGKNWFGLPSTEDLINKLESSKIGLN
jgi:DNA polymerase elongation subunit (family B)